MFILIHSFQWSVLKILFWKLKIPFLLSMHLLCSIEIQIHRMIFDVLETDMIHLNQFYSFNTIRSFEWTKRLYT